MRTVLRIVPAIVLSSLVVIASAEPAERKNETVQIRISRTLFGGVPDNLALTVMQPFGGLIQAQTGLGGELSVSENPFDMAQRLARDQVQIGVFDGIEFAWVRETQPQLKPLAISVNHQKVLKACVVVRARPGTDLNGLKGKIVAIPACTRQHCRLFLDRLCKAHAHTGAEGFFSKVVRPATAEEMLDDLVDGQVDVAVLDNIALECFKRSKPGRYQQLQVFKQSEDFPASVVVYRQDRFDSNTLEKFKEGLVTAHQSAVGKHLLTMWKLTAFEPVPRDYEKTLASIAQAYPPPQ